MADDADVAWNCIQQKANELFHFIHGSFTLSLIHITRLIFTRLIWNRYFTEKLFMKSIAFTPFFLSISLCPVTRFFLQLHKNCNCLALLKWIIETVDVLLAFNICPTILYQCIFIPRIKFLISGEGIFQPQIMCFIILKTFSSPKYYTVSWNSR